MFGRALVCVCACVVARVSANACGCVRDVDCVVGCLVRVVLVRCGLAWFGLFGRVCLYVCDCLVGCVVGWLVGRSVDCVCGCVIVRWLCVIVFGWLVVFVVV